MQEKDLRPKRVFSQDEVEVEDDDDDFEQNVRN